MKQNKTKPKKEGKIGKMIGKVQTLKIIRSLSFLALLENDDEEIMAFTTDEHGFLAIGAYTWQS